MNGLGRKETDPEGNVKGEEIKLGIRRPHETFRAVWGGDFTRETRLIARRKYFPWPFSA